MLLNSQGEWNVCCMPRLVLEDKEPEEEWSSERLKRKNISKGQGSSSSGSGGDGVMNGNDESKSKKSKLTVPLHATTPALKRTVEMDVTHGMSIAEAGSGLIVYDNDGTGQMTKAKDVLDVVRERKGKESDGNVCEVSAPMMKVRRTYVKCNMEYWSIRKRVLNLTKQVKVQKDV